MIESAEQTPRFTQTAECGVSRKWGDSQSAGLTDLRSGGREWPKRQGRCLLSTYWRYASFRKRIWSSVSSM